MKPNATSHDRCSNSGLLTLRWLLLAFLLVSGVAWPDGPAPRTSKPAAHPQGNTRNGGNNSETSTRTAKEVPSVIEIAPSSIVKVEASDKEERRHRYFSSEWWVVYLTAALSLITAALALYTARLYRATVNLGKDARDTSARQAEETKRSLQIAKETADAAMNAANAARKSADVAERALTSLERPYVFVHNVCDFNIGAKVDTDGRSEYFPSIKYSVSNHGRLPAIIDNVCAEIMHSPDERLEMPLSVSNADPLLTDRFIEVHGYRPNLVFKESTLDAATVNRADLTDREIFFRIIIYYHGPLSIGHESSSCWRVSFERKDEFTLIPYGHETYNYTK